MMRLTVAAIIAAGWLMSPSEAAAQAHFDVLHAFAKPQIPWPMTPVLSDVAIMEARDGSLLLTTAGGGAYRKGAIFKVSLDSSVLLLHSFRGDPDGAMPIGALLEASDGAFYGTTAGGGAAGLGTVYKMTPDGEVSILHSFTGGVIDDGSHFNWYDGAWPLTGLIEGADGNFYGTTLHGGGGRNGTIFRITHTGALTILYTFGGYSPFSQLQYGDRPTGPLLQVSDGSLWAPIGRTIVRFTPSTICPGCVIGQAMMTLPAGQMFYGSLVETPEGVYALAASSGSGPERSVINVTTRTVYGVPATSSRPDPIGTLVRGIDGNLYGTTARDGAFGRGTVFRLTPAGEVTIVSSFASGRTGDLPPPSLLASGDGNFYGGTAITDSASPGAVFKVTPAGVLTSVAQFDQATTGATPMGGLMEATDGRFYGTGSSGGAFGFGTVFRMTSDGEVTLLHNFTGGRGGATPMGALVEASDGYFYGTTQRGGQNDYGTVFRMNPGGVVTVLHEFAGSDGAFPGAALVQAPDGNLYGTTAGFLGYQPPIPNRGTVFRLTPGGQLSVVHTFVPASGDGENPIGSLVPLSDGTLIGMTAYGGSSKYGIVFSITADGVVTDLYSLSGYDGDYSWYSRGLGVTAGIDGSAYAAQRASCKGAPGLLLRISPGGGVAVVREFECRANPTAPPIQAPDGSFYGAGDFYELGSGSSAVLRWSADGGSSRLYKLRYVPRPLNYAADGDRATLLLAASDGKFYGTFADQGPLGGGTIFRLRLFVGAARAMNVDTPRDGQHKVQPFDIAGWAIDQNSASGSGVDVIHVWAFPPTGSGGKPLFVGAVATGGGRPDVGRVFGEQFSSSGFAVTVRGLPPETYQFVVSARSAETGEFAHAPPITLTVAADPRMSLDAPAADTIFTGSFRVAGWAIDRAAATGTGVDSVQLYAYPNPGSGEAPRFLGAAAYGSSRPDVGAAYGTVFTNSAFDLVVDGLPPGVHQLAVFAHSALSGTFNVATRTVQVVASGAMFIDSPLEGAETSGSLLLRGWAVDRAAPAGSGVDAIHVWAYPINPNGARAAPIFVGVASYGQPRPDVAAVYGAAFTNSGFSLSITALPPGVYQLTAFARSTVTGTFNNQAARAISVSTPTVRR